jgi:hypothetical protein
LETRRSKGPAYSVSSGGALVIEDGSVRLCLRLDDVRTWTCTVAVVGAHPVVIERVGAQSGHIEASHRANIPIVVA